MSNRIRPHLSYANVMSSIAVFVVLGGGAYATIDRKIQTRDLGKRVVTTPKLAQQSVGTGKLKQQAVSTRKVKPQAIGAGKLKEPAVSEAKVFDEAISTDKIAGLAVTTPKIDGEAVTTEKLAPAAVEHAKIADGAVLEQKIADEAVSTEKLGPEAVTAPKIGNGEVTKPKLANTYLETVAGARSTLAAGNVNAGTCVTRNLSNAVFLAARDIVVVTPSTPGVFGGSNLPNGITSDGIRGSQFIAPGIFFPRPAVRLCNVTGAAIAVGGSIIDWEVLRR